MMFHGSITALITPFADGKVDEKAFQKFVQWQIDQGTHGVVPMGTTGDCPTVSHEEHNRVVELCIEVAKDKIPVMAGCGSNSTDEAISLTKHAEKAGVDAALHVVPYYNKPTQEGIYQHFKAIHDATNLPIYVYNVPGRTVVSVSVDTMARLSALPRIVGVKDATGDLTRPPNTRAACGNDFIQLTGEDAVAFPFIVSGGKGCISVTSNVAPALCAQMHNAFEKGDLKTAQKIHDQMMPLHDAMFCETSPGPVKYAANLLGLCRYEFRLPLIPIDKANEKTVKDAMHKVGILAANAGLKSA